MIPKIRAVAIDDEQEHLTYIVEAAKQLGIGCLPMLYPTATQDMPTHLFGSIRLVICDLHLEPGAALSNNGQQYQLIAAQLLAMKLSEFTPYALILWTSFPAECEALKAIISTRLQVEKRPMIVAALDKTKYGFGSGSGAINTTTLWQDLQGKIRESRGLNALLQWENEVLTASDNTVRKLVEIGRGRAKPAQLPLDDELDWLLSLIAVEATSKKTATEHPRHAVCEGLHSLLLDELQHLEEGADARATWTAALSKRTQSKKQFAVEIREAAQLNDALLISLTQATGATRGAVLECWLDAGGFENCFGLKPLDVWAKMGFNGTYDSAAVLWRFIQLEGDCDAVQNKPGVIPFVLAAEVDASVALSDSPPQSIVESPVFSVGDDSRRLVVAFRFFVTLAKAEATTRPAKYRLREPLANWIATQWASYLNRPGYVWFSAK